MDHSAKSGFTGLASLAAASTMLFAALTSAYVVRRGLAGDWAPVHLPLLIPASIVLLVLGSAALQKATTDCIARRPFARMWYGGLASGMLFVVIQAWAWSEIGQSASLAGSPAAAFLYVLTGIFVLFLCGTIAAGIAAGSAHARMKTVAYYWHYLDALWISIVMLLFLER
jgi:cytochrome c oxidase subunit 3